MKIVVSLFLFLTGTVLYGQSFVTRDIRSFGAKGDGKTNDHVAFQKAAAFFTARGGNGKLLIPKGVYIIGKQIFNKNTTSRPVYEGSDALSFENVKNLTIEGAAGAKIEYANGLFFGAFDPSTGKAHLHGNNYFVELPYRALLGSTILLRNCTNIVIRNLDINGNNDHLVLGGVYGDTGIQIPHIGIFVINSTNLLMEGIVAHHFGLDGIQISNNTGENKNPDKIILRNSAFEYNARQGMSWVGGNDLTVINCKFNHTGKGKFSSLPSAGIDIEAEVGTIKNGKFIQCEIINNVGSGLVADSGPSSNCTFTDCLFWGVTNWSIWTTKPGFKFINSKIYGSFVHGYDARNDAEATIFIKCLFEDKPYKGEEPYGKFLIETNFRRRVRFDDCTMIAHKKKIVWMESSPAWPPEEKYQLNNCKLVFMGGIYPSENWVALSRNIRYKNCTFEIKHPDAEKFYVAGIGEKYNVDLGGNRYFKNKREVKL